eukprot:6208800-Pleurochrysis_carterae.AAC.2
MLLSQRRAAYAGSHVQDLRRPQVAAATWYADEVTGIKMWLPQPLVSRYKWLATWRSYNQHFGLSSLRRRGDCVAARLPRAPYADRRARRRPSLPLRPQLASRALTHVWITLGGMHENEKHVQSELKLMTLAVGTVKDNALMDQRLMLGEGFTSGIAAEIGELNAHVALGTVVLKDAALDAVRSITFSLPLPARRMSRLGSGACDACVQGPGSVPVRLPDDGEAVVLPRQQ